MSYKTFCSVLLLSVSLLPGLAAYGQAAGQGYAHAERVAIFGDSLSDTGNKYAVRGLVNEAPYDGLNEFGVPSDPYQSDDGAYFSNGRVWVDIVGDEIGDFGANQPALGPWPMAG